MRALLWKNFILKRRHPVATAFELLLPIFFILIFVGIRTTEPDIDVPRGWSDTSDDVGQSNNLFVNQSTSLLGIRGLVLPKYTLTETTISGLLMGMNLLSIDESPGFSQLSEDDQIQCAALFTFQGFVSTDPNAPFALPEVCQDKVIPYKIAIAPDNAFTRNYFYTKVSEWHSRTSLSSTQLGNNSIFTIASLNDSIVFFDSGEELEDYVAGETYGVNVNHPKIYAGIVFNSYPQDDEIGTFTDFDYTLRLNATRTEREIPGAIPSTKDANPPTIDTRQTGIQTTEMLLYSVRGFMTLQTLVARFLNCMPEWNAETQTPGPCQASESVSASSSDLDRQYYRQLENDLMLANAIAVFNQESPLSVSLDDVPDADRESLLRPLRQAPQPYYNTQIYPMPVDDHTSSPFLDTVEQYFPLIFMLSYLYAVSRVLTAFIIEKETKSRELLKIMGVPERSILASWYVTYFIIGLISSLLQTLASALGLFTHSNPLLIFLFFYLFSLDVLAFGHMMSTFFSRAKTGAFVGMAVFFMFYFVSTGYTETSSEANKNLGSLLAPVALAFGSQSLTSVEASGIGMTFTTWTESFQNYRFINCLVFMLLDFFIYASLGLYFEQVIPKEYGTTRPWYFLFTRKFWSNKPTSQQSSSLTAKLVAEDSALSLTVEPNDNIEPVAAELRQQEASGQACVIQNLRKVFPVPGGEMVAVEALSLNMYQGQITCLLGHNGAGKTTTIGMLTGMIAPTSGDAFVNGFSITQDINHVRKSVGMCPQHDVLYAELTVREHLLFYAKLKGFTGKELDDEVDKKIKEVGLTEKVNVASAALSGGMKRKLSVAIALIGDSKFVFLDEPTSGMDPYSRRSTWELLQNNRHGRVMVLTTHFMDEADLLGDKIAIMAHGQLRCYGSSMFLKNRYGAGYNLTMVKKETCETESVVDFISSFVPRATMLSNVGTEISFQLPLDASGSFAEMFQQLDTQMDPLGIVQYGISVTTMEEVFLKVSEQGVLQDQALLRQQSQMSSAKRLDVEKTATDGYYCLDTSQTLPRYQLFCVHLHAMFLKRFNYAKRDRKALLFSIFLPVLLLLLGLALLKSSSLTSNSPDYVLDARDYAAGDQSPTPYYCDGAGNTCPSTMQSLFTGATSNAIPTSTFEPEPYDTDTPDVFGVRYTNPAINRTGSTGYTLRFGQEVHRLGYGEDEPPILGQYGGYLIHSSDENNIFGYNLIVNTTSKHAGPIFKSLIDQGIYRYMSQSSGASSNPEDLKITVHSHPLPLTASTKALFNSFLSFTAVTFIAIAFAFYPAAIITFIVKERETTHNSKHQQLVSGVSLPSFWLANYLWDILVYIIPFASALILIQAFEITSFTGEGNCTEDRNCTLHSFGAVVVLFGFYGLAITPFTYIVSYAFKHHSTAQNLTFMLNFILGVVLLVVSFVLDIVEDSTADANEVLIFFWRLSPLFCLCNGLLNLSRNDIGNIFGSTKSNISAFALEICGWEILYLAVEIVLFFIIAIAIDLLLSYPRLRAGIFKDPPVTSSEFISTSEEDDVAEERHRVESGEADSDLVKLEGLRKVYKGGKVAVQDLNLGLKKGECFGYLGINGAGKTSTLKMLTGDILPSKGTAYLNGLDIMSQQLEIRRLIGYCPQFDALLDLLTVREHLELFGRIKGIPASDLEQVVMEKLHQMDLMDYETKLAGSLSGGNKRKLSVAIAMIGSPPIIFLDEPSTGMDPVSRRFMWEVISNVSTQRRESTIILTTHSMEECEALCTKVGIMVGGGLKCLGSIQHLKGKYGDGLLLDFKWIEAHEDDLEAILQQMEVSKDEKLTRDQVMTICTRLNAPERQDWISAQHETGWLIHDSLIRDEFVVAHEFADWWIGEARFLSLAQYIRNSFASVELVERHSNQSRFKVKGDGGKMDLGAVFKLIEGQKDKLHIRDYSVSQTSLEQIFNQFASQQQEEQGVARGLKVDTGYTEIKSP